MADPSTSEDKSNAAGQGKKRSNRNGFRRAILLGLGWIFVLLGTIGLFLPVLQGVLFLAVGVLLLSRASPRTRLLLMRLRQRYPGAAARYDSVAHRAGDWVRSKLHRRG